MFCLSVSYRNVCWLVISVSCGLFVCVFLMCSVFVFVVCCLCDWPSGCWLGGHISKQQQNWIIIIIVDRDSSVGIATRYGLDGPVIESRWGARFSAPVQTGPGAHPASYTMGTGSLLGVKRPGRGADHPPPSNAEVKERVELYFFSPSGPSWPVVGRTLLLLLLLLLFRIISHSSI